MELVEAEMALQLYRVWGIRPHELDQVDASILRMMAILQLGGAFDGE